MSPIGTHRTLRTVITYNALVFSLATPKQPRWRWVLMYLEDMQVGWICSMDLNQMHAWRCFDLKSPRWIQAYCFMSTQVKRIATDIITFNAAMSACENEDELVQGMAVFWACFLVMQRFALHPLGQQLRFLTLAGVGACFGFDFLLEGLLQTPWNFHVDKEYSCVADVEPHVWDVSRRSGCKRISSALILASAPVHPVPWLRNLPLRDSTPSYNLPYLYGALRWRCLSTQHPGSQWETAEVLLHGLKEHDGSRDVVTLNATITACANAALWSLGQAAFLRLYGISVSVGVMWRELLFGWIFMKFFTPLHE